MEDVMFMHKSRPLAAGFALAAAALIIGTASASAERRKVQDRYAAPYAGIVQKQADGVNYFFGSSDKTFGYVTYEVLRLDIDYESNAAPVEITQPQDSLRYLSYAQPWRPWHKKWKTGHKGDKPWHGPAIHSKPNHGNMYPYPKLP
jgi:hypothetical protein